MLRRVLVGATGAAAVLLLGAGSVQAEPWPWLRFGRSAPPLVVSAPTWSLGARGAAGALDGRLAFGGRAALAYLQPLASGGLQVALGAVEAVRGQVATHAEGQGRLAYVRAGTRWRWAIGLDLWVGDTGLLDWFRTPSPWLALARTPGWGWWGCTLGYEGSSAVAPFATVAAWAEPVRSGFGLGCGLGWDRGAWHFDAALVTSGLEGGAPGLGGWLGLARTWHLSLGRTELGLELGVPASGLVPGSPTLGLWARLAFDLVATLHELFPPGDAATVEPFDPFAE